MGKSVAVNKFKVRVFVLQFASFIDYLRSKRSDPDNDVPYWFIAFFEKVLPEYDRDRVRVSDMRKVLSWYNILIAAGVTEFVPEEKETAESAEEAEKAE